MAARHQLHGTITSAGFASGDRFVVGHWRASPLGPMTDVMWARPDGERVLLAPDAAVAGFVASLYRFDRVEVVPLSARLVDGTLDLAAGDLALLLRAGRRWALPVRRPALVTRLIEAPVARALLGVRTYGVTVNGVRQYYGAESYRAVVAGRAQLGGRDLGPLAPVRPALGFGFSEPPPRPSMVALRVLLVDRRGALDRVLAGNARR